MLFDCCVNLADKRFDADREQILPRARAAGVGAMLLTAADLASSHSLLAMLPELQQHGFELYTTCGVHPHQALHWQSDCYQQLRELALNAEVKAVGEAGLDFARNLSPRSKQIEVLYEQIQLAMELDKPLFFHERDASDSFQTIIDEYTTKLPPCLLHCFTGSKTSLKRYLDYGFYIGITGWVCDPRRGVELSQLLRYIPLDRIIFETDAPYLVPKTMATKPKKGRNEPMYLPAIISYCAQVLQRSEAQLGAAGTRNARKFLRL